MRLRMMIVFAAALLCGCSTMQSEPVATPTPPAVSVQPSQTESAVSRQTTPAPDPSQSSSLNLPKTLNVYFNGIKQMDLETYIAHVVAGEMPVLYGREALKAQAVCARTRAIEQAQKGGCPSHKGADVCTDYHCCQTYLSDDERASFWGEKWQQYWDDCLAAATATAGQIITYRGIPARIYYHSDSAFSTEDGGLFDENLPYLCAVKLPETAPTVRSVEFTGQQIKEKCHVDSFEIKILAHNASGRVAYVQVGGKIMTGAGLRTALGLSSACFTVGQKDDKTTFTTYGGGHGVGLSQTGARDLAAKGWSYQRIISYFFPGTTLINL